MFAELRDFLAKHDGINRSPAHGSTGRNRQANPIDFRFFAFLQTFLDNGGIKTISE